MFPCCVDAVPCTVHGLSNFMCAAGYLILAGRARSSDDEAAILNVLKTHFKRTVNCATLFGWVTDTPGECTAVVFLIHKSVANGYSSQLPGFHLLY